MGHVPEFDLKTRGGVCAGEEWIYDGEKPIAQLRNAIVEQPEQNLRYFNQVPKPIELRNLCLAPDQEPLIQGVQLYWKMGPVATTEWISTKVESRNSDQLIINVVTREPSHIATSLRRIIVTYDSQIKGYVYNFEANLTIHNPEFFDNPQDGIKDKFHFEYCDPWYCNLPAPVTPFPGMWETKHTHLYAECANNDIWQLPLNHMSTVTPPPGKLTPNGRLVLGNVPGRNPAFSFLGDTASRTQLSVCNWGYDVHFVGNYERNQLYEPICEYFSLKLCADNDVHNFSKRALSVPNIEYMGHQELPLYQRQTSFDVGMKLNQPFTNSIDPWPWLPSDTFCRWSSDIGRSDNYSLSILRSAYGVSEWTMDREGEGAWLERWHTGTNYRLTAYIRTKNLSGRGACLAVRWKIYNSTDLYPYHCSSYITGTSDWQHVSVQLDGPPPPEASAICIILRQDGKGTSHFDDLNVEIS